MEKREYQRVMEAIKEGLQNQQLSVGSRLPTERELAQRFSVGRYSVREALRVMESFGLIQSKQGSGNYISDDFERNIGDLVELMLAVQKIDFLQINQVRRALETEAYQQAVKNMTKEEAEKLEEELFLQKGGVKAWGTKEDATFHRAIRSASNNPLLAQLMEGLDQNCEAQIQLIHRYGTRNMREKLDQCHILMLQGILKGKEALGLAGLKEHYACAEERSEEHTF